MDSTTDRDRVLRVRTALHNRDAIIVAVEDSGPGLISQASSPGRCCWPLSLIRCGGPSAVRTRTAAKRALSLPFVPVRPGTGDLPDDSISACCAVTSVGVESRSRCDGVTSEVVTMSLAARCKCRSRIPRRGAPRRVWRIPFVHDLSADYTPSDIAVAAG